ncbi:hypothetical protein RFI_20980 [Reticulomyxa filosa]|uniref:Uncharacterized protein n=1 Tax=Reticulomyxa filosa TaxID=46433 RepID=X6MTF8_RETFI|nr:hypothetical protein RFI_20980 [Reticulomyxa filosa]|eukprot:ETO16370.1 hypothetical protein RFI_20980 [Reticulomyxa filosa]
MYLKDVARLMRNHIKMLRNEKEEKLTKEEAKEFLNIFDDMGQGIEKQKYVQLVYIHIICCIYDWKKIDMEKSDHEDEDLEMDRGHMPSEKRPSAISEKKEWPEDRVSQSPMDPKRTESRQQTPLIGSSKNGAGPVKKKKKVLRYTYRWTDPETSERKEKVEEYTDPEIIRQYEMSVKDGDLTFIRLEKSHCHTGKSKSRSWTGFEQTHPYQRAWKEQKDSSQCLRT